MNHETPEEWVSRENIARFRNQLKDEADDGQRKMLERLLALELVKLNAGAGAVWPGIVAERRP
jgi:hypothetical protein